MKTATLSWVAASVMNEKSEPPHNRKDFFRKSRRIRYFIYAIVVIAFYLLLMEPLLPKKYHIEEGKKSKETIFAPVTIVDKTATERAKEKAMKDVEPQFRTDEELMNLQIEKIDRFFSETRKVLTNSSYKPETKIAKIKGSSPFSLSDETLDKLVLITPEQLTDLRLVTREIVYDILRNGVKASELAQKRDLVDNSLITSTLSSDARVIAREIARASIVPNKIYDPERTQALKKAAEDSIKPILINKGQVIVAADEVVTHDQYQKLKELGFIHTGVDVGPYVGLALLVLLTSAVGIYYLYRFHQQIHRDNLKLAMFFSILLLTTVMMKVVALGQNLEWETIGYLAPVAFGAMLISMLLNLNLALGSALLLGIFASVIYNGDNYLLFDLRYGLVSMAGGIVSAFALSDIRNRSSILRAGLFASIATIPLIVGMYLLVPTEGNWGVLFQSIAFGLGSGLISAVLTIGFLPLFESVFGILSPLRLLDLSNPNQPLLRKLLIEAPGTYHHSIMVGNLSEAAAEAIGADGLLARVGAYYHDLGKTKRPQFFIENQMHNENPHDKISPNLSKSIILSHTKDGVDLLKKHKIPEPIQDIAAQHHGTTLLKYFYHKALKEADGTTILEEDYRYPGPKAQFKEAAIVGICDCVEAAVRSLQRPTPARIENMVRKIIQDRLEDGQFNECDLTLKELELIRKSICETLQGIFHSRIEYPDDQTLTKGSKKDEHPHRPAGSNEAHKK